MCHVTSHCDIELKNKNSTQNIDLPESAKIETEIKIGHGTCKQTKCDEESWNTQKKSKSKRIWRTNWKFNCQTQFSRVLDRKITRKKKKKLCKQCEFKKGSSI